MHSKRIAIGLGFTVLACLGRLVFGAQGFEEGLLTDRLLTYDAGTMKFHSVEVTRDPQCAACGEKTAAGAMAPVDV